MNRIILIAFCLLISFGARSEIYKPEVAELNVLKENIGYRTYNKILDGRYFPTSVQQFADYVDYLKDYDSGYAQVRGLYYHDMSVTVPASFFEVNTGYFYLYYMDWANVTGTASLPDVSATPDNFARFYLNVRRAAGNSMGSAGIADVPTTWRNAKDLYVVYMQRQELTSAQQVGIVNGIEREILAGMSENYKSTSTTARVIGFNSNSSGKNTPLVQADLVAQGWNIVSATQMDKMIVNPSNSIAYRWRVLHTN